MLVTIIAFLTLQGKVTTEIRHFRPTADYLYTGPAVGV